MGDNIKASVALAWQYRRMATFYLALYVPMLASVLVSAVLGLIEHKYTAGAIVATAGVLYTLLWGVVGFVFELRIAKWINGGNNA